MLFISQREIIKEHLLFILENGELLLSSKRYNELLEKIIDILNLLENKTLSLYRFLELFNNILIILETKRDILEAGDVLDFLIMAIDSLKSQENEIYEMEFENIVLDTFLLQSSRQMLTINETIIKNLSILNLLKKDTLEYFIKNDELNIKIFKELKDVNKIDLILAPFNEFIIQKIRKKTDKPIVVISNNNDGENLDNFKNIYFLSNKMDKDELNESLIQIIHTYQCNYIKNKIDEIDTLPPLNDTIIKLKNITEDISLRKISNIISKDIGLSTKLVSIVNKPFFGVVKEITSVNQAITFLGKEKTLAFALNLGISDYLNIKLDNYELSEDKFNKINFLRLKLATLWYRKINFSDFITISSAAMLGNIGKLFLNPIIDELDKEKFKTLLKFDRLFAEKEILNTSTEEISANLLTHWGFSNELINSIYYANNIDNSLPEIRHLAIANYVIFNTFDLNDEIDDKTVQNMADFLKEMNFDSSLYLKAIEKIKETK